MGTYVLLAICLIVPPLWSVILRQVLLSRERKKQQFRPEKAPPSDYSI